MIDENRAKLVSDFIQAYAPQRERQQPGDLTIARAMLPKPTGWGYRSRSSARDYLNSLAEKGLLKRIENVLLDSRHMGTVWRIVEPPK